MSEGITSNQLDSGVVTIFRVIVELTDAEIKALPSGDFVVLPAPGATSLITVVSASLVLDTSAGAYTNVDANSTGLLYNGDDASVYFHNAGALDQAGTKAVSLVGSSFPAPGGTFNEGRWSSVSNLANQPLVLSVGNATGNFTGGNAANTLKVTVLYTIIDV